MFAAVVLSIGVSLACRGEDTTSSPGESTPTVTSTSALPPATVEATAARATPGAEVWMVGVPRSLGEQVDYDAWFSEVAAAGVTAFLPYSAYQESPESLSIGWEADFLPPCTADSPAFAAMRRHGVKLIAAGQVLYTPGALPGIEVDPLAALIECTGADGIAAILSIDEPAYSVPREAGDRFAGAREIFEQAHAIAPGTPVVVVNAPILADVDDGEGPRPISADEVSMYLEDVRAFNEFADITAFDAYPVPSDYTRYTTPDRAPAPVSELEAIEAYAAWLREHSSGRPFAMVLQAFSFEWQLSADELAAARAAGLSAPPPTSDQLRSMACAAVEGGASVVAWYGASFIPESDADYWQEVLSASRSIADGTICD